MIASRSALFYLCLQPRPPTAAASTTYGRSLHHLRSQAIAFVASLLERDPAVSLSLLKTRGPEAVRVHTEAATLGT